MTTSQIEAALVERFNAPEWALLFEVRNCTGYSGKVRTADALAMSLWPSRGLHLHGIEVKASRSDWIKEKTDPDKAETIAKYCDFWWLAVGDEKIVQPGELPKSWGLLVPKGERLICRVEPTQFENPAAIDRKFLAAVLRKCAEKSESVNKDRLERYGQQRYNDGLQRAQDANDYKLRDAESKLRELQSRVRDFEAKSGVRIDTWHAASVGEQFNTFVRNQFEVANCKAELGRLLASVNNLQAMMQQRFQHSGSVEAVDYLI